MSTGFRIRLLGLLLGIQGASTLSSSAFAEGWSMFHGDRRHSGFSTCDAPFDSLLNWSYLSSDSIFYSSPVVAEDGTIYIGNLDKELLAISPEGNLLWRFRADGNFRYSTPAIAQDGTIYIGGSDGTLYAVNPDSTLKWTFNTLASIKTSPNIAADGTVYFGADDGRLYAVNPNSTLKWFFSTGDTIRSSPAIGPDGTVFFGSMDTFFYAVWPNGSERWRAATGDIIKFCSPAVSADGIVYFGSYDGFLYAISSDQQFQWAYFTDHVIRSSPAIGPDGKIFFGVDSTLIALRSDGGLEWDYETGGIIYSSPAYFGDDDVVGVGSDDGAFYCIHADDGSLDWRYTVGEPIRSSPAPSPMGDIYVGDLSGVVWAFGTGLISVDVIQDPVRETRPLALPNPSSGRVVFKFDAAVPMESTVIIYEAAGREVIRLRAGGSNTAEWDGLDHDGRPVAAGMYFYRFEGSAPAKRFILLR